MAIKNIFRRKEGAPEREYTIEDLVTLERYEEAAERLRERLKVAPKDLHAHLKMAEVHVALKDVVKALDEFLFVADSYADDGFFEKAIALLSKSARLAPGDDTLPRRIERYRRLKTLEHRRKLAIEGLRANQSTGAQAAGNSALAAELLWNKIAKSHLVEKLSGEQLRKLFSVMQMTGTQGGQVLAEEGSHGGVMYLLVDGVVEAAAEVGGKRMGILSFSTGDLIGDSVLLEHKPWPARYEVTEGGTVFQLDRGGLEKALTGNEDPRGFISVLRQQHKDRDVAASLLRLRSGA